MSYTIDVYRGKVHAEKNLATLATYVCLFPQLVAGADCALQHHSGRVAQQNAHHRKSGVRHPPVLLASQKRC